MSFEDIVGNNKIKRELQEIVKNNSTSHSYLFSGEEGIGKKLFAKEFSRMLLCLKNNKACGECSSCVKFDSENNPDFSIIEPDGNSIKIAQIRELQENVYIKPIVSSKKVFIINDSDKMTEEAQNSLLKTLEEPPEYIIIILVASNENKLLNTIKSRCLKIGFNNIDKKELIQYIVKEQIITNPSDGLLSMCNGSIGKLIKIKENLEEYNEIEKNTKDFIECNFCTIVDLFKKFDILYKSKEIIIDLLDYMIVIMYEYVLKNKEAGYLLHLISDIENTKRKLISNTNYDMCIDELLLKMCEKKS